MTRNSAIGWGAVALGVMAALGVGPHQDWQLRRNGNWDTVLLTVKRFTPGHGKWAYTSMVPFANLRGLSWDAIDHGGKARFEYVEDAGKLVCEGGFAWGKGEGSFTFVPSAQFRNEVRQWGYDAPTEDQLFSMTLSGMSLEFARLVHEAGVTSSIQELMELRTRGVTREFLGEVKDAGYSLTAREIAELRDHGVDGNYLRQLREYGLHPQQKDLIGLRMQGVTPRFLDGLKAAGYEGLAANEIVSLHQHGVSPDFVQTAHDLGYSFSVEELTRLRNCGVDGRYLRRLQGSGMRTLTAEEIAKLRQNGVD